MSEAMRILEERTGGALIVVTLGARGALARLGGRRVRFPAYALAAVDTTGAGDVFHGAFAVACGACVKWRRFAARHRTSSARSGEAGGRRVLTPLHLGP